MIIIIIIIIMIALCFISAWCWYLFSFFFLLLNILGLPEDINKIGKLKALFKDISQTELDSKLYLVCRLVRRGKMMPDPKALLASNKAAKKEKGGPDFRRFVNRKISAQFFFFFVLETLCNRMRIMSRK